MQKSVIFVCGLPFCIKERAGVDFLGGRKEKDTRVSVFLDSGSCLSSRAVSSQVLSVYVCLTSVFGMGTGGTTQLNHRKGVLLQAT